MHSLLAHVPICVFSLIFRWEAWQSYPVGYCPPPSDHYLLPLFAPFTLFLLLVVGEGKVGHRDRPEFGGYDLSSPTPNQCISLSANTPCFCLLVSVPG